MSTSKTYTFPIAIFAVLTLGGALFGAFSNYSWASWVRSGCYANGGCFCEAARGGPIEQLSNTYSNLSYVLIGLLICFAPPSTHKNLLNTQRAYTLVYGLAVIAIGAGSFFYHGSLTEIGRWFDWFGMYLYASFLILYNIARLRPLSSTQFIIGFVILNLALGYIIFSTAPNIRQQIFGLLIGLAILLEYFVRRAHRPHVEGKFFYAALGCLVAAYTIWIFDNNRMLCDPQSWLQGHAAWHILTAMAAGLMFLYLRTETPTAPNFNG